jgi:hypothetical protein
MSRTTAEATKAAPLTTRASGHSTVLVNRGNNVDRLPTPFGYQSDFSDDHVTIGRTDVRDSPELAPEVPLPSRTIRLPGGGPMLIHGWARSSRRRPTPSAWPPSATAAKAFVRLNGTDCRER